MARPQCMGPKQLRSIVQLTWSSVILIRTLQIENPVNDMSCDLHISVRPHTDFVILLVPWRAASGESKVSLSPSNLPCWSEWCTYNTFLSACIFAVLKVNAQIVSIITVQECCEGI